MSNIMQLLEALGRIGIPFPPAPERLDAWLTQYPLEPCERSALLRGDQVALSQMLGGRDKMIGTQYGEEDSPEGEELPLQDEGLPDPDAERPS